MNPDDLSRAFRKVAPSAPSPGGWLDAARRRRRRGQAMVGAAAAVAAVAVIVPLAVNLGGSAPTVIASPAPPATTAPSNLESDDPPTGFNEATRYTEPSVSATESPSLPISGAAEQASYAQEALLLAHPDIFSGFGFADDNQVAVLYYKRSEEARAEQLAAGLVGNPASRLESRRNSWADLISRRHAVSEAAVAAGVTVVDSAPDMMADGVVLIVPADQVDSSGQLTVEPRDSLTRRLRDLGMIAVEADPRPAPVEIAGFRTKNGLAGGRFRGLPSKAVTQAAQVLVGLVSRHHSVFTEVRHGPWNDDLVLSFKESRRSDVDRLLSEAGVDLSIVQLLPRRRSFDDLEVLMQAAAPRMETLPPAGRITGIGPSAEYDGLVIWMENPRELEQLTPAQLEELRAAGIVAVEQGGKLQATVDQSGDTGFPAQKTITQPTVAPTDQ